MATAKTQPKIARPATAKAPKKAAKTSSGDFAVIVAGGKQFRVSVGDTITIEKLKEESQKGDKVAFDQVLLKDTGSATTIGAPFISGAKVEGEIESVGRAPKILVIKYKQKSRYFKKNGHRQPFLKVKVTSIK